MARHVRSILSSHAAAKQLETITSEAELHALDRALVVFSRPSPVRSCLAHCAALIGGCHVRPDP
ncbi:hypothetical protein FBY34_5619 [Streptomyces sp. SLBN-115]|nr:hypothetical protein FBY34_5619 [Streptomyces sp. SLBN-115]